MKKFSFLALTALLLAWSSASRAEVIMYVYQSGSNVITSASGTLDTTDLTYSQSGPFAAIVSGTYGLVRVGPTTNTAVELFTGASGPSSFGSSNPILANSGSGDEFGVAGGFGYIYTPNGYTSGASLSATDTYTSTTIAGLGLTAGTYTYNWGTGADADSLVVNIGTAPSVVPEPSSLVLAGLGIASAMVYRLRRRKLVVA